MQTPGPDFVPTAGFIIAACLGALPILGVMVWGAVKIFSPITQALARRLLGGGTTEESLEEIAALNRRMDGLQAELAEAHERLDFTERMLAQRTPDQLSRG